jgi:FkbM family methyltransferase
VVKMLNRFTTNLRIRFSRIWFPESKKVVVHTRINDYDLLVLANEDVGRQIHYVGSYESAETDFLRKEIFTDSICVDVGANVGYFAMLMAQSAHKGSVHAFEPIALNAALLIASAELNGFTNISINQCAVGDINGDVSFSQSSDSAFSSMLDTDRKPLDRTISVPCVTLDKYLDDARVRRVDVLKADVEGAEEMVITGAKNLLSDEKRKPRVILMELFETNLQTFGSTVWAVVEKMHNFGYRPFVIDERGEILPFTEELKLRYYNVLFLPTLRRGNK